MSLARLKRSFICARTLLVSAYNPRSVYGWGANDFGQLAQVPAAVTTAGSASTGATRLIDNKSVHGGMCDDSSAVELRLPSNLFARCVTKLLLTKLSLISTSFLHQLNRSVACGDHHTLLVTTAGTLLGTGATMAGQLGIKTCDVKTMISKVLRPPISTTGESFSNGFGSLHQMPLENGGMILNRTRKIFCFLSFPRHPDPVVVSTIQAWDTGPSTNWWCWGTVLT